jgi:ATP-dependent helicase/nuclease subunit A
MSIHAAKGLEAPFVFLMNANSVNRKQDPIGVMVDWPPASPSPNLVCAYDQSIAQGGIASALAEEKKIAELEKWNVLYVAMTRAKQYFVASGSALSITPKNLTGINDQSWYAHLIASGMPIRALDDLPLSKTSGLPMIDSSLNDNSESNSVNYPHIEKLPESFGLTAMTKSHDDRDLELPSDFEDVWELTTLDQEFARELGVAIHLILERYAPSVREQDHDSVVLPSESSLGQWLGIGPEYAPFARESAQAIFNSRHLQGFFRGPDLLDAWDEVDLFNQSGERFRVDRIVELTDRLIILDYKLHIPSPSEPSFLKYRAQLSNYRQLLGGLRVDKPIQSFLVDRFGDVQEITE